MSAITSQLLLQIYVAKISGKLCFLQVSLLRYCEQQYEYLHLTIKKYIGPIEKDFIDQHIISTHEDSVITSFQSFKPS